MYQGRDAFIDEIYVKEIVAGGASGREACSLLKAHAFARSQALLWKLGAIIQMLNPCIVSLALKIMTNI